MAMFKKEQMQHLDNQERTLLELINHEPKQIDDIAQQSGIGISHLIVKLLEMEFKGLIRQLPGKYYIKN